MKRNLPFLTLLILFAALLWWRGPAATPHAEKPPMFSQNITLAQAREQSAAAPKLILAMATADWCGPCQQLKKGALRDPRVEAWALKNTIPVYIDTDTSPEASTLLVTGIPTLIIYKGDRELARQEGVVSADELLAWFEEVSKAAGV